MSDDESCPTPRGRFQRWAAALARRVRWRPPSRRKIPPESGMHLSRYWSQNSDSAGARYRR